MSELDSIDRRILDLLQQNGRLTMTELGEQVGLSTSPCSQRVKRLEAQGVITGYHARVNPAALGRSLLGSILQQMPVPAQSNSYVVMEEVKESFVVPLGRRP